MKQQNSKNFAIWVELAVVILLLMILQQEIYAQPGPPPGHGQNGNQGAGGMAPIGEGLAYLFTAVLTYGIVKVRSARRKRP